MFEKFNPGPNMQYRTWKRGKYLAGICWCPLEDTPDSSLEDILRCFVGKQLFCTGKANSHENGVPILAPWAKTFNSPISIPPFLTKSNHACFKGWQWGAHKIMDKKGLSVLKSCIHLRDGGWDSLHHRPYKLGHQFLKTYGTCKLSSLKLRIKDQKERLRMVQMRHIWNEMDLCSTSELLVVRYSKLNFARLDILDSLLALIGLPFFK